ncbi:hypothetical protein ACXXDK_08125 [Deinococcus sp. PESE-38]
MQLRRGAGGTLRLHDQFGRLDTPGDQDLHLLALAYYCGEPPARLAEISGLPQPAVEEALLSAISRLPGLAQEALAKAAVPAPSAPEEPTAEAAEDDLFPTLSSLAATAPVTRVEPWEPPRRPEQREPGTEAEAVLPEASEATVPVSEPLPNAEPEATQPAEQSPETTTPEAQA